MRSRTFALAATGSLLAGVALGATRTSPVEATLLGAVGVVLAGTFAGVAAGLSAPDVPRHEYTAVGSTLVVLSIFGLVLLGGRPEAGLLAALLGGGGAALVGFDSGLDRASTSDPVADGGSAVGSGSTAGTDPIAGGDPASEEATVEGENPVAEDAVEVDRDTVTVEEDRSSGRGGA